MSVKPGCDIELLGVNLQFAASADVAYLDDAISVDREIPDDTRTAGAVEKSRATNDDVVLRRARDGGGHDEENEELFHAHLGTPWSTQCAPACCSLSRLASPYDRKQAKRCHSTQVVISDSSRHVALNLETLTSFIIEFYETLMMVNFTRGARIRFPGSAMMTMGVSWSRNQSRPT